MIHAKTSWICRLLLPLEIWVLIALGTHAIPSIPRSWEISAGLLTTLIVFATTGAYTLYSSYRVYYPKRAYGFVALAILLHVSLAVFLPETEEGRMLGTILLLLLVPIAGQIINTLIERKEYIVPAMMVAMVSDTWSVFWGPSKALIDSNVVQYFTVNYPVAGMAELPPQPLVGIMDWIFVAFLFQFAQRYHLSLRRFTLAMVLGFSSGLLILHCLNTAIPLLTTIAPCFVLLHYPSIRPGSREIKTTLVFCSAMILFFCLARLFGEWI